MTQTLDFIDSLQAHVQPVQPEDTMAEAGRKALLTDFIDMLKHEEGSRIGDDIEHVHDMRVATRRMRSTLRLLNEYYKPKAIRPHERQLRKIARALGAVRDLDVLIHNLQTFNQSLNEADQAVFQSIIERLDAERAYARHTLVRLLDKGDYRRFVSDYAAFLTNPGKGAYSVDGAESDVQPTRVRHLLPSLIYEHLGTIRAYDAILQNEPVDPAALHALRIEFKRLRYLVSLFSAVLGSSIKDFITELKSIQDHLGTLNDLHVAQQRLTELSDELTPEAADLLARYIETLKQEEAKLTAQVGDVWKRFNGKTIQRQLATSIASL